MRNTDLIHFLAGQEGRRLRSWPHVHDEDPESSLPPPRTVSWIDVQKNPLNGRLRAVGRGHSGHDNAGRMPVVCSFFDNLVLPYLGPETAAGIADRTYAIELHDTYTYLDRPEERMIRDDSEWDRHYGNVMVFSRDRFHAHPVLVPDPYQMTNFGGALDVMMDTVPWQNKAEKMFFAGTTTGNRDPRKNERIKKCVWSLNHRDVADFYITHVAQMDPRKALAAVPDLSRVYMKRFAQDHHTNYRIAVNIAGNTCSWSRIPMIMKTRSVLFDFYTRDTQWYGPAMQDGLHYVSVELDNVLQKFETYRRDEARCNSMCDAANNFVASFTRSVHAAEYMKHLLESSVYYNAA